jgi:CubicO group peptidase (beta-lactamase class C family)
MNPQCRLLPLCLLLAAPALASAADPRFAAFAEALEKHRKETGIPALTAAILEDGKVVWEGAYGTSDDEGEERTTPDTTFFIASVTKPLAATALLQEVAAGRLSLQLPLSADPEWGGTCAWLATSGIPFGSGGKEADGTAVPKVACERALTLEDVLHMRVNAPAPDGPFVYNPIVYARLDRVLKGAGKGVMRELVRAHVARRAGMRDTALGWRDPEGGAALRLLAPPFAVEGGERKKAPLPDDDFRGAAGVYTSVRQLARFDQAWDAGRLLPPAWRKRVEEAWRTRPGYAYGWFNQAWRGRRLLWHSGWEPGAYSALYLKVPERRLTLLVLANSEGLWWGNSLVRAEVERSPVAAAFLETVVGPADAPPKR